VVTAKVNVAGIVGGWVFFVMTFHLSAAFFVCLAYVRTAGAAGMAVRPVG